MADHGGTTTGGATTRHAWAGREVVLAGRLASLSHDEAVAQLRAVGATVLPMTTPHTDTVVVGQWGPPVGPDGETLRALTLARSLSRPEHVIEVVSEDAFLAAFGLEDQRADLDRLYTSEQLGRILDVPPGRIRGWVRRGLIKPVHSLGRLGFFDFRQVAAARALHDLVRAGASPSVIRRSLDELGTWAPDSRLLLTQLESMREGELMVRLPDGRLVEPSGQGRLAFPDAGPTDAPAAAVASPHDTDWFAVGVAAEADDRLEDAVAAFRRSLRLQGPRPETWFNIGNCLYLIGQPAEASGAFQHATELDPDYAEAWNNLGNVRGDLGDVHGAIDAYTEALGCAPEYADVHFNLAETLAETGDVDGAIRHWRAYLGLDPHSREAQEVRAHLEQLENGTLGDVRPLRPPRRDGEEPRPR